MTETIPPRVLAARARRARIHTRRMAAVTRLSTRQLIARHTAAHDRLHTAHGIRGDDRRRREIVEHAIVNRAVCRELVARGATLIPCRHCNGGPDV